MQDIQSKQDHRNLTLEQVGIKNFILPLLITSKTNQIQPVTATINFYASLDHTKKGQHMSRFIETLSTQQKKPFTLASLAAIAKKSKKVLDSQNTTIEVSFVYFYQKKSPVSRKKSIDSAQITFKAVSSPEGESTILTCSVSVMLLCPCSKAISKHNAHNQRGVLTVILDIVDHVTIEDIISLIEDKGSAKVYPILKRVDEKFVTEASYKNPRFVEDTVRDVALALHNIVTIKNFTVSCESMESIHNHNAFAQYTTQSNI